MVTVTATSTPTPKALNYVLTEGSQLSYKVGTLPDSMESLVGSMELRGWEESDHLFDFKIIDFDFRSEHFHLVGNEGSLTATMQDGETLVFMQILTSLEGSDLELSGRGSAENVSGLPPTIRGLEIFGGDETRPDRLHLILYIFASPLR
jgi:hypothetical protein